MPQGSPESEVTDYRPLAFAIAYRMTGSVAEAEDTSRKPSCACTRRLIVPIH
jgi:hypothetical protein